MLTPRFWLRLLILPVLVGCQETAAPLNEPDAAGLEQGILGQEVGLPTESGELHIPRQSPAAPPLDTYQVSFWARKYRASTIRVNYQAAAGELAGQPFLWFHIPAGGLKSVPSEPRLGWGDSVLITLTIDPVNFSVEFQPSGLAFSKRIPASLFIWYGNADPDLNGDGVVDATDQALAGQLSLWSRQGRRARWRQLLSAGDATQQFVFTAVHHFSEFAVSW